MKIFYEIIIEEINDKIKSLKQLVDKLCSQSWNFYNREHRVKIAEIYEKIKQLKELKQKLREDFIQLSNILYNKDYISSDEDETSTKDNRDFE